MYDTAPVRSDFLTGWTWCDLLKHDEEHDTWQQEWEDCKANNGYTKRGGFLNLMEVHATIPETVKSQKMEF